MDEKSQEGADLSVLNFPLRAVDVAFRKNARAKRYILRFNREGGIQVTIPRYGTQKEALAFANEHRDWIEKERQAAIASQRNTRELHDGDSIFLAGEKLVLRVARDWGRPFLKVGTHQRFIADEHMDLTRPLRELLRDLALSGIPPRVRTLADSFGLRYEKVVIRDQKTRWGSCSSVGAISLNWRLVMMPEEAMDYVIIHELMHLREMNHSDRFWKLVEEACPEYKKWVAWLDTHGVALFP